MVIWFVVIGVLRIVGIIRNPGVLVAAHPTVSRASPFWGGLSSDNRRGSLVRRHGQFGRFPIRLFGLVLPALVLNYAGQTALMIDGHAATDNPFYRLAPSWSLYPLVILATLATVIASQAIIAGAFSLTRQAMPDWRVKGRGNVGDERDALPWSYVDDLADCGAERGTDLDDCAFTAQRRRCQSRAARLVI